MKNFFIHFLTPSLFFTLLVFISFVGRAQDSTEFEFESAPEATIIGEEDTTNFFFEPRVVAGTLRQRYEEKYGGDSEDFKWEDITPFAGLGMTLGYKNFAVDVYAQQTASGKDSFYRNKPMGGSFYLINDYNTNLSREDYAINLSYARNLFVNLDDRIVLSLGYKAGKTAINGTRRDITPLSTGGEQVNQTHEETQFETSGPTIGISYGFPIGEGVIGLNFGYAWLKTDFSSPDRMNVDAGSTSGLTLGLLGSYPITNNLMFSFSVDGYQYTMVANSAKNTFEAADGNEQETEIKLDSIEESVVSVKVSLSYAFDF